MLWCKSAQLLEGEFKVALKCYLSLRSPWPLSSLLVIALSSPRRTAEGLLESRSCLPLKAPVQCSYIPFGDFTASNRCFLDVVTAPSTDFWLLAKVEKRMEQREVNHIWNDSPLGCSNLGPTHPAQGGAVFLWKHRCSAPTSPLVISLLRTDASSTLWRRRLLTFDCLPKWRKGWNSARLIIYIYIYIMALYGTVWTWLSLWQLLKEFWPCQCSWCTACGCSLCRSL